MSRAHQNSNIIIKDIPFGTDQGVVAFCPLCHHQYNLINQKGPTVSINALSTPYGTIIDQGATNYITTSNMQGYAIGYTGNVCGFSSNWEAKFGAGNWSTTIIKILDSPVYGLDRVQRIETYANGWGGWVGENFGPATGDISYGMWIRLWQGEIQFGDLNTANYITVNSANTPIGKWIWVSSSFSVTSNGSHLYVNGITKVDILAVQIGDKKFPTSYVDGTDGDTTLCYTFENMFTSPQWTISIDYWHPDCSRSTNPIVFMSSYTGTTVGFWFGLDAGTNNVGVTTRIASAPNMWHKATFTWDGTNSKFYLDGILMQTNANKWFFDTEYISFGSMFGWGNPTYLGCHILKNFIINNRALTTDEAISLYHSNSFLQFQGEEGICT